MNIKLLLVTSQKHLFSPTIHGFSGFLSPRPPPQNTFSTTLFNAIRVFSNLRVVQLVPRTYHEDVFTQTLQALKDASLLEDLTVNSSCTDAQRAPLITQIECLTRLELQDPTRAILDLLPAWLDRLSGTLTELHLKVNKIAFLLHHSHFLLLLGKLWVDHSWGLDKFHLASVDKPASRSKPWPVLFAYT